MSYHLHVLHCYLIGVGRSNVLVLRDRLGRHLVGLNVKKTTLRNLGLASHQRACPTNSTSLEPA
jgi:hypothetical protein